MGIEVEPFGQDEARRFAARLDDARWARLARDAMVAGHLRPGDLLWTTDPHDFAELGVAPARLHAVGRPKSP
jgi:hypothetical protein